MTSQITRRELVALLAATAMQPSAWGAGHGRPTAMRRLIANENPYGPGPAARAAAEKAVGDSWRYAVREVGALKAAIAELEGVERAQIMLCAGSTEALRVGALALAGQGGRVIAARPTFAFLPDYARKLGCEIAEIDLDDVMVHDLDSMAAAVNASTRLVYVCNPNNPTGTRLEADRLSDFIDAVSPTAPVFVDEAYMDLDPDWAERSCVRDIKAGRAVIVTRTFSKLHGMAGLRVGYAIGPVELIKQLESLRVSMLSYTGTLAATASLGDTEFLAMSRARIREGRDIVTTTLESLNRPFAPSHGNFVFFDTGGSSREFAAGMRERGILTGMPSAAYPGWSRVSVGTVEDMRAFAVAARDYFGNAG